MGIFIYIKITKYVLEVYNSKVIQVKFNNLPKIIKS